MQMCSAVQLVKQWLDNVRTEHLSMLFTEVHVV